MNRRPRILFLTPSWPLGRSFGGQLRALHIGRALKAVGPVRVVVVNSELENDLSRQATEAEFTVLPPVRCQPARNNNWLAKTRRAIDTSYFNVHGELASGTDRLRVSGYCHESDLIWLLNSRTPNVLQRWAWPRSHLDIDDIPSAYVHTLSQAAGSWGRRRKLRLQAALLYRRERILDRRFATLSVCSREDRDYLGGGHNIHVIPNAFAGQGEPDRRPLTSTPRVGFIGPGSFEPNRDAVNWFLGDIWPLIQSQVNTVRFRLIGKDFGLSGLANHSHVDVLGEVVDPAAEIATWSAMVVPIRLGAGTRIKIAEAFSRKCPVVSTRIGAYGYDVRDGIELRLADSGVVFAQACVDLIVDPATAAALAERAFARYLQNWTWAAICPRVWEAVEACLRVSPSRAVV